MNGTIREVLVSEEVRRSRIVPLPNMLLSVSTYLSADKHDPQARTNTKRAGISGPKCISDCGIAVSD